MNYLSFPIHFKYTSKGIDKNRFFISNGFEIGRLLNAPNAFRYTNFSYNLGLGLLASIIDELNFSLEIRESLGLIYVRTQQRTQSISLLVGLSYAI